MLPSVSAETLARFLSDRGIQAEFASLDRIVPAILEFYETVSAAGLGPEPDSDMLLFQYGVYDWGKGEFFELDLTRQFVAAEDADDDAISQLRCTTFFEPTIELRTIQPLENWCHDRTGLAAFRNTILASGGYQAAQMAKPVRREIWWGAV